MNIVLVTCLWKRPELTRIIADYYASISNKFNITLVAAYTEGDKQDFHPEWNYIEKRNDNLPQKFNGVVQFSQIFNPDMVVLIGSDNLISHEWFQYISYNYSKEEEYVLGLKDFYFYDNVNDEAYHWKGFNNQKEKGMPIGAGRVFSEKILNKVGWCPWGKMSVKRGLDTNCSRYLKRMGIGEKAVSMNESGCMGVDIKSGINLNDFSVMKGNSVELDSNIFRFKWGYSFDKIRALQNQLIINN